MWTPPDGQARFQNRVGGSLVRYCRMSGLLMQPLLAAGPYGVREIGSKSDKRARRPSAIYWFFRSCLVDRLPLLRSCVLLSPSPGSVSLLSPLSFRRPVRRQREPGRSPFSVPAPRPSAPYCWRAPRDHLLRLACQHPGQPRIRDLAAPARVPNNGHGSRDQEPPEITLAQRSTGGPDPGRKSSKVNWDCTICVCCRWTGPCWTVPRKREDGT